MEDEKQNQNNDIKCVLRIKKKYNKVIIKLFYLQPNKIIFLKTNTSVVCGNSLNGQILNVYIF